MNSMLQFGSIYKTALVFLLNLSLSLQITKLKTISLLSEKVKGHRHSVMRNWLRYNIVRDSRMENRNTLTSD